MVSTNLLNSVSLSAAAPRLTNIETPLCFFASPGFVFRRMALLVDSWIDVVRHLDGAFIAAPRGNALLEAGILDTVLFGKYAMGTARVYAAMQLLVAVLLGSTMLANK